MTNSRTPWFRLVLAASLLPLTGAVTTAVIAPAAAQDFKAGALILQHPWTRATAGKVGAGFVEIVNAGKAPDTLISVSSSAADKVEIHTMTIDNGIMRMRPLLNGITVPAGTTARLKPGGNHIMLIGLKAPLAEGMLVPLTLNFAKAGPVKVQLKVEAAGAAAPANVSHAN